MTSVKWQRKFGKFWAIFYRRGNILQEFLYILLFLALLTQQTKVTGIPMNEIEGVSDEPYGPFRSDQRNDVTKQIAHLISTKHNGVNAKYPLVQRITAARSNSSLLSSNSTLSRP